jgi:hypothetical protein
LDRGDEVSQESAGDIGGNRGTGMQTTALAGEIANYAIYQLKNQVTRISEMEILEQEDVRDIIRNAALHILNEHASSLKGA